MASITTTSLAGEVVEALELAGEAARADGRDELTAEDLLDALSTLVGERAPAPRPPAPARVTPYRDGPYLLRGAFELTDVGARTGVARRLVQELLDGDHAVQPLVPGPPHEAHRTAAEVPQEPVRPLTSCSSKATRTPASVDAPRNRSTF